MKRKKIIKTVGIALIAGLLLIGCSNDEITETEETTSEVVQIETESFVSNQNFANDALSKAFNDYHTLLDNFVVGNYDGEEYIPDENGTDQTSVLNDFDAAVEPEFVTVDEENYESYLQYTYEGENEEYVAVLQLYFIDDHLTQVSMFSNQTEFTEDELLNQENYDGNDLESLNDSGITIAGLSHMVFEDTTYDVVAIPTVSTNGNQMIELPIISQGDIVQSNAVSQHTIATNTLSYEMDRELRTFNSIEILGIRESELNQTASLPRLQNHDELTENYETLSTQAKEGDVTAEQVIEQLGEPTNQSGVSLFYQSQAGSGDMYNVTISLENDVVVMMTESYDRKDEAELHNFSQSDLDLVSQMSADSTLEDFIALYDEPTSITYIPVEDYSIYTWESPSEDAEVQVFQLTFNSDGTIEQIGYN